MYQKRNVHLLFRDSSFGKQRSKFEVMLRHQLLKSSALTSTVAFRQQITCLVFEGKEGCRVLLGHGFFGFSMVSRARWAAVGRPQLNSCMTSPDVHLPDGQSCSLVVRSSTIPSRQFLEWSGWQATRALWTSPRERLQSSQNQHRLLPHPGNQCPSLLSVSVQLLLRVLQRIQVFGRASKKGTLE